MLKLAKKLTAVLEKNIEIRKLYLPWLLGQLETKQSQSHLLSHHPRAKVSTIEI
jgi:hypothetical protein